MEYLRKLPVNFSAFPQKVTTWFGLRVDPPWEVDLNIPANVEAKAEVFQLARLRNTKHRTYIGLSLESSKVKDLNEYIGWINQIHYLDKTAHFYISTDCGELLLELLNILKWCHHETLAMDFFAERNKYYCLEPEARWAADVNLLSRSDYIISTPHNFKGHVASEISGIRVLSTIRPDVYVTNLDSQKVL